MGKRSQAIVDVSFPSDLYTRFGAPGSSTAEVFQNAREATWNSLLTLLDESHGPQAPLVLDDIMRLDRSLFWLLLFNRVASGESFEYMTRLWARFRKVFNPALDTRSQLMKRTPEIEAALEMARLLGITKHDRSEVLLLRGLANKICFGPFSEAELSYVVRKHPRIIEVGAGSGYLSCELLRRGVDVHCIENNDYGMQNEHPDTVLQLAREERWHVGDGAELVSDYSKNRSLVISWAQPRSDVPVRTLRAYRKAGGRHFLFKPGAFFGERFVGLPIDGSSFAYAQVDECGFESCLAFLWELIEHWEEIPNTKLPFYPQEYDNALFAFRLRRS